MDTPLSRVWVVNDLLTAIPGTKTFWHHLLEWFDAHWHGEPFETLAWGVERAIEEAPVKPRLIIRNGTYFQWFTTCHRPVISLIQDITPYHSQARELQVNVGLNSNVVVFNSSYTREHYPELAPKGRVIPLGVDFDLFRIYPRTEKTIDVCWVGAASEVKGWQDFIKIVTDNPSLNFACVTKDGATFPANNVNFFTRLPETAMVEVYNHSRVGLCTSLRETQHLSGIEMAACGVPVVAPPIGVYHGVTPDEVWAFPVERDQLSTQLRRVLDKLPEPADVRLSADYHGLAMKNCRLRWESLVEGICND